MQTGFGGPEVMDIVEVPNPVPAPDEVVVRLHAVSTCYVDTAVRRGLRGRAQQQQQQQIPGHEGAGTIDAVGDQAAAQGWRASDRVLLLPRLPCSTCAECARGKADLCAKAPMLGQERPGTHAELVAVHSRMLVRLPDGVPFEIGAITGCTLATAIAGIRCAGVDPGATVVVRGATGGIGIYVALFAKAFGARRVVGLTRSRDGAGRLVDIGIDAFLVDARGHADQRFVAEYPEMADCFIDLVGGWQGSDYTRWVRRGGALVLLGDLFGEPIAFNPSILIYRGVRILTALCGTPEMARAGLNAASAVGLPVMGTVWSGREYLPQLHDESVHAPGKRIVVLPERGVANCNVERCHRTQHPNMEESMAPETSTFDLSADQVKLQEEIREFAASELTPKSLYWDDAKEFPWPNVAKMKELGLMGFTIPEQYGGAGRSYLDLCLVLEQLSRACHVSSMVVQMNLNGPPLFLRLYGTEEQKQRYLPMCASGDHILGTAFTEPGAGSALSDITTTAKLEGDQVVLNGGKHLVTHGHVASLFIVLTKFVDGPEGGNIGIALVERDTPGFSLVGVQETMRGGNEAILEFEDCRVPVDNILIDGRMCTDGLKKVMEVYNAQRLGNAMISVGLMQSCLDDSIEYMKARHQFGRPIGDFQGLQWYLAEMHTLLEASRQLCYVGAARAGHSKPDGMDAALAKLMANGSVERVASLNVQIHGGGGYMKGSRAEWVYRAARGQSIAGGTLEVHKNLVAKFLLSN